VVLTAFLSLGVLSLGGKLAQLQVMEHARFAEVATAQRFHTVRQDPLRGDIVDRQGRKLASSRNAFRLQLLYPSYMEGGVPNRPLLNRLADLLRLDERRLEEAAVLRLGDRRFYEPLLVKDDLSPGEVALVAELRATMPGLYLDEHPVRVYPQGNLAAHLLGHVGLVSSMDELSALGEGYEATDTVGKLGAELQYEKDLRGAPGFGELEVDAYFRPTGRTLQRTPATAGYNLQLTVDTDLQRQVQTALERTLKYVSTHPDWNGDWFRHADVGAAVVMDVKTGGILAMASYPSFNPNRPQTGDFYNLAIRGRYMPGSTWKMLTASAALEYGVVKPDEKLFCGGVFDKVEPKLDWKPDGHGWVNLESALANSCNIYFYEMGYRLGPQRLSTVAGEFGFGRPLGIDLPGEDGGVIPGPAASLEAWKGGQVLSAAIGQGELAATPLQLARYTAVIANGGLKVRPHVASALVDSSGRVVKNLVPQPDGRVHLTDEAFHYLQDGMVAVTEWGTSRGAFQGLPFAVAGKTGTAEVEGKENCAGDPKCQYGVYVAFAPADHPEVAVAVVGERAGHGDSINPVVRAVLAQYFQVQLAPDDPLYTMGILDRP
jgi:penicillin-binding protein 2